MKHAVILCHPDEDSFNATVAQRYCDTVSGFGHSAIVRDLYRIGFDPVLQSEEKPGPDSAPAPDVRRELDLLSDADVIVLVYPIWYGMPPALMKGYIDRVLGAGVAYRAGRSRTSRTLLSGKRMLTFTSSATTAQWLEEQGALASLRTLVDKYLRHAFGLSATRHVHFPAIVPGLRARFVEEAMFKVQQAAQDECCALRNSTSKERANPEFSVSQT